MSLPLLVGFSGKKNSGKDTLALYLKDRLEKERHFLISITGFGVPLKKAIHKFFEIPLELLFGSYEDKCEPTHLLWDDMSGYHGLSGHMSIREVLQYFGTDIMRRLHSDVWCNALYDEISTVHKNSHLVFLVDERFPNEVVWTKNHGGYVIRLTRTTDGSDLHESETALDNYSGFDAIIDNNKLTLEDTKEMAYNIVSKILENYRLVDTYIP